MLNYTPVRFPCQVQESDISFIYCIFYVNFFMTTPGAAHFSSSSRVDTAPVRPEPPAGFPGGAPFSVQTGLWLCGEPRRRKRLLSDPRPGFLPSPGCLDPNAQAGSPRVQKTSRPEGREVKLSTKCRQLESKNGNFRKKIPFLRRLNGMV